MNKTKNKKTIPCDKRVLDLTNPNALTEAISELEGIAFSQVYFGSREETWALLMGATALKALKESKTNKKQ